MEYLKSIKITADNVHWIIRDLVNEYSDDVWNFSFLLVKDRATADDITQEVFLHAFRTLHRFEGRSSPKTWLLAMARNKSINWLKSSFIKRVTLVGLAHRKSQHRSAEQEAIERSAIHTIWQTVMKLPAKQREVLILDAHYEFSYMEIAQILNVSEGTVKSRLHRARAALEKMLKENGEV